MLELGCIPDPCTQLRIQFYNNTLDRGVDADRSKKAYANEVNVIFDYWPNEIYYWGVLFGYAHPQTAARYWNASDDDTYGFVVWAGVVF